MARLVDLTAEELLLIPNHRQFWYEAAISKAPIDRSEFQTAIETIYKILGLDVPKLHFCDDPCDLIEKSRDFFQRLYHCEGGAAFVSPTMAKIHELHLRFICTIGAYESLLGDQLSVISEEEIENEYRIDNEFEKIFLSNLPNGFDSHCFAGHRSWVYPRFDEIGTVCWIDFHFSVIRHTVSEDYDELAWQAYRKLILLGGWFVAFESDCFVCDRPHYDER